MSERLKTQEGKIGGTKFIRWTSMENKKMLFWNEKTEREKQFSKILIIIIL